MRVGYLLDTNVISEFVRLSQAPDPKVEKWLDSLKPIEVFTSVLVCGEIQKGIEQLGPGKRRTHLEHWLHHDLPNWLGSRILAIDQMICVRWGHLTMTAKSNGIQLPVIDGLIAATAVCHGLTVATRNTRHFSDIGVDVLNPW